MNLQLKGFCLSAGIHGICLLSFVLLQLLVAAPGRMAVIDFTFAGDAAPVNDVQTPAPAADPPRRAAADKPKKAPADPRPREVPARDDTPRDEIASGPSEPATETISPNGEELAGPRASSGEATGDDTAHVSPSPQPAGRTAGPGSGITPDQSRAVYLKEHFVYIRDRINRSILYPEMARKMGWCGQVKIAFVVAEDGGVDDIRVVASSGFGMLDRNAVDTVKKVAPFPRPPVSAEIRMAVTYRLN